MITGSLSSLGAFYNFTTQSCCSTSSIMITGISTSSLCGLGPLSSILSSKGGKNLVSSSLAYSL